MPKIVDGNIVSTDEEKQVSVIESQIKQLLSGLGAIESPVDFGYAYKARLLAAANGENMSTILAITNRSTASSYVTGMSQFQALTLAQRQWLVIELESQAYDAMIVRLLLT